MHILELYIISRVLNNINNTIFVTKSIYFDSQICIKLHFYAETWIITIKIKKSENVFVTKWPFLFTNMHKTPLLCRNVNQAFRFLMQKRESWFTNMHQYAETWIKNHTFFKNLSICHIFKNIFVTKNMTHDSQICIKLHFYAETWINIHNFLDQL